MDLCMDLCDFKFDVLLAVREKQRGVIIVLAVCVTSETYQTSTLHSMACEYICTQLSS